MPRPKRSSAAAAAEKAPSAAEQSPVLEEHGPFPVILRGDEGKTAEEVLKDHHFWEGWAQTYKVFPLGPGYELHLPHKEMPDPEDVGFSMKLPPVEYALRNERKYPPPSNDDMFREMFKLVQYTLKMQIMRRSYVMSIIYNHICRNYRDSPGWQRGFIKAKGPQALFEYWQNAEAGDGKKTMGDRYWIMAIFGRMVGTCKESRRELIRLGVVDYIIEGTKDEDPKVKEVAVFALRGLIQHDEGREAVSYEKLISTLAARQ